MDIFIRSSESPSSTSGSLSDAFRTASAAARPFGTGKAPGRARLLFVGKLIDSKRPHDLLRAAALVAQRSRPVDVAFAGAGDAEGALRQAAADAGVLTIFHGFVNQSGLPAIYAAADAIVCPSVETWGLVVNEAMACGVPAVVSDAVGCGPDLVDEGATGSLFRLGDVAALAQAIERVLALDPQHARAAIERRMAVYSPDRTAQGIMDAAAAMAGGNR